MDKEYDEQNIWYNNNNYVRSTTVNENRINVNNSIISYLQNRIIVVFGKHNISNLYIDLDNDYDRYNRCYRNPTNIHKFDIYMEFEGTNLHIFLKNKFDILKKSMLIPENDFKVGSYRFPGRSYSYCRFSIHVPVNTQINPNHIANIQDIRARL